METNKYVLHYLIPYQKTNQYITEPFSSTLTLDQLKDEFKNRFLADKRFKFLGVFVDEENFSSFINSIDTLEEWFEDNATPLWK